MATLSIDIPAGQVNRVLDGVAAYWNYQSLIDGQANPESKSAFAKRMLINEIKGWVRTSEQATAAAAAAASANTGVTLS